MLLPDPLYPERSFPALFARCARAFPDRIAASAGVAALTYAELDAFAKRIAFRLRDAGGRPGERVAVLMPQEAASFSAMLGILKAGQVVVMLDPDDPHPRL